jgi:hypothetical protein
MSGRFSLSRLSQKLVSANPGGHFLGLSPQALCFLSETVFERSCLFVPAANLHGHNPSGDEISMGEKLARGCKFRLFGR